MKLHSIHLQDFRCFEEHNSILGTSCTIFIGKNGSGKSTVLTALNKLLLNLLERLGSDIPAFKVIGNTTPILRLSDIRKNSERNELQPYAIIKAEGMLAENIPISWSLTRGNSTHSRFEPFTVNDIAEQIRNSYLPILCSFSDTYPAPAKQTKDEAKDVKQMIIQENAVPKNFAYTQAYTSDRDISLWQERFLRLYNKHQDYINRNNIIFSDPKTEIQKEIDTLLEKITTENDEKSRGTLREKIAELVKKLQNSNGVVTTPEAQEIMYIEKYIVEFSRPLNTGGLLDKDFQVERLYVEADSLSQKEYLLQFIFTDGRQIYYEELPAGYKRLYSIVFEIAARNYILNKSGEPEGIVSIDEIELHLHPALQQEVLARFQRTFPKIQFIITTHSPLVITNFKSDGKENKIILLSYNNKTYDNNELDNIYGIDYTTGLTEVMGVSNRPSTIETLMDSIVILTKHGKKEHIDTLKNELFAMVGTNNTFIQKEIDKRIETNK